MIKLFDAQTSGNCYRVRLMLALARVPYEIEPASVRQGEIHAPGLRELNPLGEVPVLIDGPVVLRDSQAILVYLAKRYAPQWLPQTAAELAAVMQWLSFASNEIQNGPRYARAITLGLVPGDVEPFRKRARRALDYLDRSLDGRDWLETGRPTVADVACYPYIWNADQGKIDMQAYPRLGAWLARVRALPGYVPMAPGDGPAHQP